MKERICSFRSRFFYLRVDLNSLQFDRKSPVAKNGENVSNQSMSMFLGDPIEDVKVDFVTVQATANVSSAVASVGVLTSMG